MKNKGLVVFGIFVIALIIAFAIYKSLGQKDTVIVSGGGSTTTSTNGIGALLSGGIGSSIGGFLKGLFN